MTKALFLLGPALILSLGGCIASTAVDLVTAPVRAASQTADWMTTSQDEADRSRGREIRRREEQMGELQREYARQAERCQEGNDRACREAVGIRRTMDELRSSLPEEPSRR